MLVTEKCQTLFWNSKNFRFYYIKWFRLRKSKLLNKFSKISRPTDLKKGPKLSFLALKKPTWHPWCQGLFFSSHRTLQSDSSFSVPVFHWPWPLGSPAWVYLLPKFTYPLNNTTYCASVFITVGLAIERLAFGLAGLVYHRARTAELGCRLLPGQNGNENNLYTAGTVLLK